METSLLVLLESEKRLLIDIKFYKESIHDFSVRLKEGLSDHARESHQKAITEFENKVAKAEENLLQVGKEIKQYLVF